MQCILLCRQRGATIRALLVRNITKFPHRRQSASHRAWQELPRHLRRRAASHDVRRVPLRLRDKAKAEVWFVLLVLHAL